MSPLTLVSKPAVRVLYLGDRRTPGIDCLRAGLDVDFLWCNSQHQISLHEAAFRSPMPIVAGCCGFDKTLFYPVQKPPGIPIRFLHNSVPYRGLARVLEIWPFIHRALPDSELHITGGYTLWGYTLREADELTRDDIDVGLLAQPGVVYHGALPRSAYAEVVRHSDILLYPTDYEETCCIAALEASAAGVVPVVSAVGALAERVHDHTTGVLLAPGTRPAVFATTAIRLARDLVRLRSMSGAAARSVQDYSIERTVNLLEQAIESCMTR